LCLAEEDFYSGGLSSGEILFALTSELSGKNIYKEVEQSMEEKAVSFMAPQLLICLAFLKERIGVVSPTGMPSFFSPALSFLPPPFSLLPSSPSHHFIALRSGNKKVVIGLVWSFFLLYHVKATSVRKSKQQILEFLKMEVGDANTENLYHFKLKGEAAEEDKKDTKHYG
jgi:hypothetical protein